MWPLLLPPSTCIPTTVPSGTSTNRSFINQNDGKRYVWWESGEWQDSKWPQLKRSPRRDQSGPGRSELSIAYRYRYRYRYRTVEYQIQANPALHFRMMNRESDSSIQ